MLNGDLFLLISNQLDILKSNSYYLIMANILENETLASLIDLPSRTRGEIDKFFEGRKEERRLAGIAPRDWSKITGSKPAQALANNGLSWQGYKNTLANQSVQGHMVSFGLPHAAGFATYGAVKHFDHNDESDPNDPKHRGRHSLIDAHIAATASGMGMGAGAMYMNHKYQAGLVDKSARASALGEAAGQGLNIDPLLNDVKGMGRVPRFFFHGQSLNSAWVNAVGGTTFAKGEHAAKRNLKISDFVNSKVGKAIGTYFRD